MNNISWYAFEYKKREKTVDWYWAVIIISISIIVISVILHNILFALVIILSVFTLLMYSRRDPLMVEVDLGEKGIRVGKDLYPYLSLEAFWVDSLDEDDLKILLKSKKQIMPIISVPISEYSHEDVRNFLLEKLEEKELHEPLSQKVMEKLGF